MTDEHGNQEQSPLRYEGGVPVFPTPADRENAARNAEKKEQQEYNREQVAIQRGIFRTQIALVFFGVIGTIVSGYQAHTARISAEAAQKSTQLAETSAELARDTLIETSKNDARQSVASTDALQTTIDHMHLDQRAWIGVGDATVSLSPTTPWEDRITIYNNGKTPANRMVATGSWMILPSSKPLSEEAFKKFGYRPSISQTGDLFPGAHIFLEGKNGNLIQNQPVGVDEMRKGKITFYIFGEVDYLDVFGIGHWQRYCYVVGTDLKASGECKMHNDSDADYPNGYKPR